MREGGKQKEAETEKQKNIKTMETEKEKNHMEMTVGTKWEEGYVRKLAQMGVNMVYGSLRESAIGNARASAVLPEVSKEEAVKHVELVHSLGMRFGYTLNSPCLGNMEFTAKGQNRILEELDFIYHELKADQVIITVPSLMEIVRKRFPDWEIKASIVNQISTVESVRSFIELGADVIVIDNNINRKFKVIEAIRSFTDKKLEVLANDSCLLDCPYKNYHYNISAHSSRDDDPLDKWFVDYCVMKCMKEKCTNPELIIKSSFIRPEDVGIYEDLGIDVLKINTRHMPADWGLRAVKAYADRSYDGNLLDIICPVAMTFPEESLSKMEGWKEESWAQFIYSMNFPTPEMYLDNRKLDGFLEHYRKEGHDCDSMCGISCNYCKELADKTVTPDPDRQRYENYVSFMEEGIDNIIQCSLADENTAVQGTKWDEAIRSEYEDLLTIVPWMFRSIAQKKTTAKAEQFAAARKSAVVEAEDMVKAVYSETPNGSMKKLMAKLEKYRHTSLVE